MKVKLYLNHAGYCWAKESHSISGGRNQNIKFHALWGLIEHPKHGYILYDTAYTDKFFNATNSWPNKIYAIATKVVINKEDEVVNQLKRNGINPEEINHIIITHFHADHIAGLKDFPNSNIITSKTAYNYAINISSSLAFTKGILKDLIPKDINNRISFIEDSNKVKDPIFNHKYDVFNDGSIFSYDLPGHASGQIGIELSTENNKYFLIADACWLKESYEKMIMPHKICKLFFDSWKDYENTLQRIHKYFNDNPNTIIVPTHCSQTTEALINSELDLNVL